MLKSHKSIIPLIIILFLCNIGMAQSLKISIKNGQRLPLYGAHIQLVKVSDSTKVNGITGENGMATFDKVENGLYSVSISYVGFQTLVKSINVKPDKRFFEFRLTEKSVSLSEVTVTAHKPIITQEDDKMIIDPEPMASTSTNTLEVLENTPGIYVDQDGGIFLNSANPATIYINGREQKMSSEDILTLLRSLPPGSVQRIEILRTPSTKFDANSTGGIVNVVLKKGVKIGRFINLNAGMNQGIYGNRFAGLSYNDSGDKTTGYLNLNFNLNDREDTTFAMRRLRTDTSLSQSSLSRNTSYQGFIGYGLTYDIRKNLVFSYDGRVNFNMPKISSYNYNDIETIEKTKLVESENQINTNSQYLNIQQDFGINKKLDTIGSNWDTKFSYSYNNNYSKQDFNNTYLAPIQLKLLGDGENKQQRHFLQIQSDFTFFMFKSVKVETGVKSSYQYYQSNADYYSTANGIHIPDSSRTNAFSYKENINAVYLQASKTLGWKFLLKSGVRLEQTYMNGNQTVPTDTSFLINRVDLFPYVYLSRPLFSIMGVELKTYLIYRKTISRPDYQSLNPYRKYIDEFQVEAGNPNLRPQFTDNIEMNVSVDDFPLFAIGQNYTKDIFSSVTYKDKVHDYISVRTYDNLGKRKETYIRGMVGIPPGGRYFFGLGAQYNLNEYDGVYENQPLTFSRGSWQFFTFHSLRLFKETKFTLSGFMMVNGQQNFYQLNTFGQLNVSLNQTLLNKRLIISINMRDILKTMVTEFELNQGSTYTTGSRYSDNQRFGINIRYNLGITKKDERKKMMVGEQEE
jgi:iron complex outermembrane recepter protein